MSVFIFRGGSAGSSRLSGFAQGDDGGDGSTGGDAAGTTASAQRQADWQWWFIGLGAVVVGVVGGMWLESRSGGPTFKLEAGIGLFALLFVAAQAIERVAELVSYVPTIGKRFGSGQSESKEAAQKKRNAAIVVGVNAPNDDSGKLQKAVAAEQAAEAEQDIAVINANRACFFFGFNALLAACAAGYFDISLLRLMGGSNVPNWLDLTVTALAISGGTKPLHDLISKIEANKQQSEKGNEISVA